MAVIGLLSSWASPAPSEPSAASRRVRRIWSCAVFSSAVRSSTRSCSSSLKAWISSSRRRISSVMRPNARPRSAISSFPAASTRAHVVARGDGGGGPREPRHRQRHAAREGGPEREGEDAAPAAAQVNV